MGVGIHPRLELLHELGGTLAVGWDLDLGDGDGERLHIVRGLRRGDDGARLSLCAPRIRGGAQADEDGAPAVEAEDRGDVAAAERSSRRRIHENDLSEEGHSDVLSRLRIDHVVHI